MTTPHFAKTQVLLAAVALVASATGLHAQTSTSTTVGPTTTSLATTSTTLGPTTTTLPPTTHQRCYKVSDALKLRSVDRAWLETVSAQLGTENCRIAGGSRFLCVPITVQVTAEVQGSINGGAYAPITRTPLASQQTITQERICYKVKCVDPPTINADTVLLSDEYSTRQVSRFKASMVCGPTMRATCGNGVVDFGEQCDDGNNLDRDCCTALCMAEPAGETQLCDNATGAGNDDTDGNPCTEPACDGLGHCLQTQILPSSTMSCPDTDANSCTLSRCNGAGACNQSAILQPTTTSCPEADSNDCTQARCDGAGGCNQSGVTLADGVSCGDTDGNPCTRALCDTAMCTQGNLLSAGTLCPDSDLDQCTTAGCDGAGTCEQDFFVRNCTLPLVCNPSTGACE